MKKERQMQKAIFFDRDGVVNINTNYVYKISDFRFMEGFLEFFSACKKSGFLALVVTNQSGINRGFYSELDFKILSDFMQDELRKKTGFCFDKIYHCPHSPSENCICRKPKIGMIQRAMSDFSIDLKRSFLIGDNESDIECAINAGIGTQILLTQGKKAQNADSTLESTPDSTPESTPDSTKNSKATYVIDDFQKAHSIIAI